MTLVIAGHDIKKDDSCSTFGGATHGLFVAADSTITSGNQTLLSGFKKIYILPIKVYEPYFVGETFRGYHTVRLATNCFIAFAGSTVTAQHILNGIGNHLGAMRYAYEGSGILRPGAYKVLMDCEPNSLYNPMTEWADDMFLNRDMEDLLSGDIVANTVHHVLNISLGDAKRHKIDEQGWNSLLTQYVLGIYCEVEKRNRLFTFKPRHKREFGEHGQIVDIEIDQAEIHPGELVVLGMMRFEAKAKAAYQAAFEAKVDVKKAMFNFLNMAIDEVQANGNLEIDRPSLLKVFDRGDLTELDRRK
jgi:hypothetical protein